MSRSPVLLLILYATAFLAHGIVHCVLQVREDAELSLSFRFCFSICMKGVTKSEFYNSYHMF